MNTAEPATPDAPALPSGPLARLWGLVRREGMEGTLARGAIWAFGINVAGTLLAFLVQLLLARVLGAGEYGVYVYTLGWLNIVLLLAKADWDHASLRYLSAYSAQRSWALLRGFVRRGDAIVGMASITVAAVGAVLVWVLRDRLSPSLAAASWAACILLPITAFLQVKAISLQGLKRVVESQLPLMVLRPLLFGGGVAAAAFVLGVRLNAALAIWINLTATGIVLMIAVGLLRRAIPREAHGVPPAFATREWLKVASGMLAISAAQLVLSQNFDVVVVGTLLDTTAAGYYAAAGQLALLVHFGVGAVLFSATPLISELFARGDQAGLQRLVRLTGRINVALSLPLLLVLAFGGRLLLGLYGPSFVVAYPILLVLLGGHIVGTTVGSLAGYLMTMTGHQNQAAAIIGACAALYVVLAIVLTLSFGAVGTATATALAYLARGVALDLYIRRRLGIEAFPFARLPRVTPPARDTA